MKKDSSSFMQSLGSFCRERGCNEAITLMKTSNSLLHKCWYLTPWHSSDR